MRTINITVPKIRTLYPILLGSPLSELKNHIDFSVYSKIAVVTDELVAPLYLDILIAGVGRDVLPCIIPAGEKSKSITQVTLLWDKLLTNGFDRKSLVIALGGGVISDLSGFVAATYMRGVDCVVCPTTLLSVVDASVGGKTGVDFEGVKNIIGTFTQPKCVYFDSAVLKTLKKREFASGMAEIIKHGLIADDDYFKRVVSCRLDSMSAKDWEEIIAGSIQIKSRLVEEDPHESGVRKMLNFGHTIGHALEALSLETEKALTHGEAVALGMIAEAFLSQKRGYISRQELTLIEKTLFVFGLPRQVKKYSKSAILMRLKSDKKNSHGKLKFTLLKELGKANIYEAID